MGWHIARCLSAVVSAASALIAARLAVRLGLRRAWLVVVLFYAQPLCVVLSFTTLTENFTALYLIAAVSLLHGRRPITASVLFSLALLTRHEAIVLLPLWGLGLLASPATWKRKAASGLLSLWAPAVHNVLYWLTFGAWPFSIFLRPTGSTEFVATGPLAYIPDTLYALTPVVAALAVVGGLEMIRRGFLMVPAIAALFFLTHAVIKAIGVYASGGYGRFLVAVAPFVAIMAAAGLNQISQRIRKRNPMVGLCCLFSLVWIVGWLACETEIRAGRLGLPTDMPWLWGGRVLFGILIGLFAACASMSRSRPRRIPLGATAAILAAVSVAQWWTVVKPLRLRAPQKRVLAVVKWLHRQGLENKEIFAANPWFSRFLDLIENPRAHKGAALLASMPIGTLFIWDSLYSPSDYHGLDVDDYVTNASYRELARFGRLNDDLGCLIVFEKVGQTPVPEATVAPFPKPLTTNAAPVRGIYYLRGGSPMTGP